MRARLAFASSLLLALAACTGGAAPKKHGGSYHHTASSEPSSGSGSYGGEYSGDSESSSPRSTEPTPDERPGLGTVWGENVVSHVRTKPFVRAASSPFAAVGIHYNDAEGVDAQTRYLGAYSLSPLRAYTPHGGVSVALTDVHGNLLEGGTVGGRNLVVGQAGERYNIVIENRTGGRYEVVASVDGLDVIDGRPADFAKRGYILEPNSSVMIDGFRRSDSTVAAFRFGRVADSYAARTSGDRNVGVIGVAFFAEQGSRWTTDELYRRDTANPFPGDRNYARPPGY